MNAFIRLAFAVVMIAGLGCSDAPQKQPTGAFCGDGSLDPGELCDPAIPAGSTGACPDSCSANACSASTLVGSAQSCDAECVVEQATCVDADGCCAAGCTVMTDSDCPEDNVCANRECGAVTVDEVSVDCGTCSGNENCVNFECVAGETSAIGNACVQASDCDDGGKCLTEGDVGFPGGYCTSDCTNDSECPAGTICIDTGECFLECLSDEDCTRPGYVCGANADQTEAICVVGGTGEVEIGGPCNETADCTGGAGATCLLGFPGGYCSRSCQGTADCPAGSACDSGGFCLQECATTEDCRDGYSCGDEGNTRVCGPGATGTGAVGDACNGSPDCAGGEWGQCSGGDFFPGNYCTIRCGDGEGTCPAGSFCVAISNASICFDSCDTTADCRAGYECSFDFGDPEIGGCIGPE